MRRLLVLAGFAAICLWSPPALPCGGGFGAGLEIKPAQTIVVTHRNGIETYIFNPSFCGEAAEFGLILPIPDALSENPELASTTLFFQLDRLTAPNIEYQTACRGQSFGVDGGLPGGADASTVQVINAGQVGIFDWVLLRADTAAEFTNWLEANGFPYDPSATEHFGYYVTMQWYFVAFKVTAGEDAPPQDMKLCGNLGPLRLSFPTNDVVIPARIAVAGAADNAPLLWEIYSLADSQLAATAGGVESELLFSGTLYGDDLTANPVVGQLAAVGDRLTKLQLIFWPSNLVEDIYLTPDWYPRDFRQTIYRTTLVDCDNNNNDSDAGVDGPANPGGCGCSSVSPHSIPSPMAGLILLALALMRRRRR